MTIGDIIGPEQVVVGLRVADKAQLLRELAERAATSLAIEPAAILEPLIAREKLGSTGLGKGFALPHARLQALTGRFALFARLARPIAFAAIDERPVDLVVLLLTPADSGSEHLATLAAISRPLRDEHLLHRLREAPDATALHLALSQA